MLDLLRWFLGAVVAVTTAYGLYHFVIALRMFRPAQAPRAIEERTHRFAVVTCAKDEERVIGHLIDSLRAQDYPPDAFDIVVVADNCTDRTAGVAATAGALVYERSDDTRKSKGFALNWFFPRFLAEHGDRYDACVIFDADNLVDPGFLAAMNRQLNAGIGIATGYRMGKNPTSSWIAGCSTLFWLLQSRLFHTARNRWGLPCVSVGGTGFMFDLAVLPGGVWETHSVCEDIEFTLDSIAAGHFVGYAADAHFYDEQPLTFVQSMQQRYRWALGSLQVMTLSMPKLWRAMRAGRPRVWDAFLFSLGGPTTAIGALSGTLLTVITLASDPGATAVWIGLAASGAVSYVAMAAIAVLVLRLEHTTWPGAWKTVATFPIYLVTWQVINLSVLFYRDTHWHDIPHIVSVGIADLQPGASTPVRDDEKRRLR